MVGKSEVGERSDRAHRDSLTHNESSVFPYFPVLALALALALAIFYPLGWAGVVVVTGAMLLEPIFLRRPPGGNERGDSSTTDQE